MNLADNEIIPEAEIIPTDKPDFEPKKGRDDGHH